MCLEGTVLDRRRPIFTSQIDDIGPIPSWFAVCELTVTGPGFLTESTPCECQNLEWFPSTPRVLLMVLR